MSQSIYDVVIIGGGPAGLTAGLYTSRAKLKTLLLERMIMGGQVMTTTRVENYPGFPRRHRRPRSDGALSGTLPGIRPGGGIRRSGGPDRPRENKVVTVDGKEIRARAVIITTGAEPRKLGVPGELEFTGRGVSYCATCDGAFFRDVPVAIVGRWRYRRRGGPLPHPLRQQSLLIHRRDQLRATTILQERLRHNEKIEILWNRR